MLPEMGVSVPYHPWEVNVMKKSGVIAIVAGVLALLAGMILVCVYMRELRNLWTDMWDKLQAKRANLQVYMD